MANIHESHRKCVIYGKEFVTNIDWKLSCSKECAKKRKSQMEKKYYRERKILKKWSEKSKCKR